MKTLTFAAGVAAGYVLGTRAGREKYEQILEGARNLANQPAVAKAQERVRGLVGQGAQALGTKVDSAADSLERAGSGATYRPAPRASTVPPTGTADTTL